MSESRGFETTFRWKKAVAFVTTSLAAFCLVSFLASLSLKDFKTLASVDISSSGTSPETFVQRLIGREMTDARLMQHVNLANSKSALIVNPDISNKNLPAIRNSIEVQIRQIEDNDIYRVTTVYRGRGTVCERLLTSGIVDAVKNQLTASGSAGDVVRRINALNMQLHADIADNATGRQIELAAANKLVDELNAELSEIHQDVESLISNHPDNGLQLAGQLAVDDRVRNQVMQLLRVIQDQLNLADSGLQDVDIREIDKTIVKIATLLNDGDTNSGGGNVFQNTNSPMRVVNASLNRTSPVASVLNSLTNLDTDSIHAKLSQVRQNLRADARQIRDQISSLNRLTKELTEKRFEVESVSAARTLPVDSGPGPGSLFLFGMLAVVFGTFVTMSFKPELLDIGFSSADDVSKVLGIPVVSTLDAGNTDGKSAKRDTFANSIVRYCEVGLFGFALLLVVLCVAMPDIREAFIESPFYGLARIGELFFGS